MTAQDRAADLLVHYFRIVFEKSGAGWDSDNTSEIYQAVDQIAAMVRDEVRAQLAEQPKPERGERPAARVVILAPDDEHVVIEVDGSEVASANHDEHGWSGMDAVVRTAVAVAEAAGLTVEDAR